MYTKRIGLFVLALAMILILSVVGRVSLQIYENVQITRNFSYNGIANPYESSIPMDEMDLSELDRYLNFATTLISIKVDNTLELPKEIIYYEQQDGEMVPALELPKGTMILWMPTKELNDFPMGYGLHSYPTYEKGWRYAKPFMVSGKEMDYRYLPFYYFVKTSDIEYVARKAIRSTEPMIETLKNRRVSVQDGVFTYTRLIDNLLYENGVFFSPDLIEPIWRTLDTIMMGLAVALLLLSSYMQKKIKTTQYTTRIDQNHQDG